MAAALVGAVAAVATSPDVIAVGTDAGDQFAKPGRRGQFCNNAAGPGGCRGHAVATRSASGDAAAAVAVTPRAHDAVAMSLDAGQQLILSPADRDHVVTTEHPWKVIVAAPRSAPDAVATTVVSGSDGSRSVPRGLA